MAAISHYNPDSITKIALGEEGRSVAVLQCRPQFQSRPGHDLAVAVSLAMFLAQESLEVNRYTPQVELRRLPILFH